MSEAIDLLRAVLVGLQHHQIFAIGLFVVVHVTFAVLLLPCSPLTTLAGVLWGVWLGLPVSVASAVIATMVTFTLGRRAGHGWIDRRFSGSLVHGVARRVLATLDRAGWKGFLLLQINPLVPASSFGYVAGASRVRPRDFFLVTLAAMGLPQIALVGLGSTLRDLALAGSAHWYLLAFALLFISAGLIGFWGRDRSDNSKQPSVHDEGAD